MLTSVIKMLELPTFAHMISSVIYLSHMIKFVGDVMDANYNAIKFVSSYLYFKKV